MSIGKPKLNERGFDCCGKPQGCTNMNAGCAYLNHPYKRMIRKMLGEAQECGCPQCDPSTRVVSECLVQGESSKRKEP